MSEWRWEPNITVSIWGRGKATLCEREKCSLKQEDCKGNVNNGSEPQYPGDCDNCKHFRGAKMKGEIAWGTHCQACCALLLQPVAEEPRAL